MITKSSLMLFFAVLSVLAVVAATLYLARQPVRWERDTSLVVLPSERLRPVAMTDYYEELNVGQVVRTYAAVLRLKRVQRVAAGQLGLSRAEARDVEVTARVLPNTAVISLTTVAPNPASAERMGRQVVAEAQAYVEQAFHRFQFEEISESSKPAQRVPWWRSVGWDRWVESKLQ